MQLNLRAPARRGLKAMGIALASALGLLLLRKPLLQMSGLTAAAGAMAFILAPLARFYERKLSGSLAALAALLSAALALSLVAWLLLPPMTEEAIELIESFPALLRQFSSLINGISDQLEAHLNGLALPRADWSGTQSMLSRIATGTISAAFNVAQFAGRTSLAIMLAYFFLKDRDRLLLRLELLVPRKYRQTAVCMGGAVCRELRMYLQAQVLIALVVGALSTLALSLTGVRSALILGPLAGLMNMVPYFGPFIGGIPAVLIALADSWRRAVFTLLALILVQQVDNALISPRIMGNVTGLPPALVLLGIFTGDRVGGLAGMLFALPLMVVIRTIFIFFIQRYENI